MADILEEIKHVEKQNHNEITHVHVQPKHAIITVLLSSGYIKKIKVSLDDYVQYHLRKGIKISNQDLDNFELRNYIDEMYLKCLRKLAMKDRTVYEICKWLKDNSPLEEAEIQQVIEKLKSNGFLDDEKLCREQIIKLSNSFYGSKQITEKLKQRGLKETFIHQYLSEAKIDELENAKDYANKIIKQNSAISVNKFRSKLQSKLMLRGYHRSIIEQVMADIDVSSIQEKEPDVIDKVIQKSYKRYRRKYDGYALKQRIQQYCMAQGFPSDVIKDALNRLELDYDED
ncbi:MAG: RecX family transcriptional regulator [Bulleidia sp.]|nr:RecX family transcriptional regulator [Bulleidia sp.]